MDTVLWKDQGSVAPAFLLPACAEFLQSHLYHLAVRTQSSIPALFSAFPLFTVGTPKKHDSGKQEKRAIYSHWMQPR